MLAPINHAFRGDDRVVVLDHRAHPPMSLDRSTLEAMLASMSDFIFVISRDGVYLDYHAAHVDQLFAPPEQFLGRHLSEVLPPASSAVLLTAMARIGLGRDVVEVEYTLPMPDGDRVFEARLAAIDADRILSIDRIDRDITDRRRNHNLIAGRLISSQEAERQRIARELHDDLSQQLALLNLDIDRLGADHPADPELSRRVRRLSQWVGEIARDVHHLSHELHPARLQALGLVASIASLCRDVTTQHNIEIDFSHAGIPERIPPDIALCIYRVVQEALNNVVRHSGAARAAIILAAGGGMLRAQIADQGKGFQTASHAFTGLGLVSMRERAAFVGGDVVVRSLPGAGTRVGVRVPLHVEGAHVLRSD
jgi:signal transduction histidine kinase